MAKLYYRGGIVTTRGRIRQKAKRAVLLLTQYVLGGGVAAAKCVTACTPTDGFDGICETTTGAGYSAITPIGESCGPANDCDGISMCVARNGQSKCELPCTSP